ncbi:hypothetical protein FQZ97_1073790 [compost metagenome]
MRQTPGGVVRCLHRVFDGAALAQASSQREQHLGFAGGEAPDVRQCLRRFLDTSRMHEQERVVEHECGICRVCRQGAFVVDACGDGIPSRVRTARLLGVRHGETTRVQPMRLPAAWSRGLRTDDA